MHAFTLKVSLIYRPFTLQVRLMISDTARHKLLVLSGQCSENSGELILQSGSFSFFNFIDIFTDQEVSKHNNILFFFILTYHTV